jgi:hypothetical protein
MSARLVYCSVPACSTLNLADRPCQAVRAAEHQAAHASHEDGAGAVPSLAPQYLRNVGNVAVGMGANTLGLPRSRAVAAHSAC